MEPIWVVVVVVAAVALALWGYHTAVVQPLLTSVSDLTASLASLQKLPKHTDLEAIRRDFVVLRQSTDERIRIALDARMPELLLQKGTDAGFDSQIGVGILLLVESLLRDPNSAFFRSVTQGLLENTILTWDSFPDSVRADLMVQLQSKLGTDLVDGWDPTSYDWNALEEALREWMPQWIGKQLDNPESTLRATLSDKLTQSLVESADVTIEQFFDNMDEAFAETLRNGLSRMLGEVLSNPESEAIQRLRQALVDRLISDLEP
jgi:hypothetical protein